MRSSDNESRLRSRTLAVATVGLAAASALGIIAIGSVTQRAAALPVYAEQTKLPCSQCHVNPAGGTDLTDFGKKFQANGHKLPQ